MGGGFGYFMNWNPEAKGTTLAFFAAKNNISFVRQNHFFCQKRKKGKGNL
jgi:hypothetical protein